MKKKEAAIIMAYTGITMLTGKNMDVFIKYVENKLGYSIWTHELSFDETAAMIKEASKDDFMNLCKKLNKEEKLNECKK